LLVKLDHSHGMETALNGCDMHQRLLAAYAKLTNGTSS
jgi:hypothetical protein